MPGLLRPLLALVFASWLGACAHAGGAEPAGVAAERTVILVSIDGFRADYLKRGVTPTLAALAAQGGRAERLIPSFPSLTFPNHYTLVTGRHPDRHGVVGNSMEDPAIPGRFALSDRRQVGDRRWWDEAEPIWVTAERAGVPTATMFWPGADAAIGGVRPGLWVPFQQSVSGSVRVDIALAWLGLPEGERPRFVTLYFDTVDSAGHDHGPDSPELNRALTDVDAALKRLLAGLDAQGLRASTDIVVVSDHGMAAVSPDRVVVLDDLLPTADFRTIEVGALAGVAASAGRDTALQASLVKPHPHMACWRKADVPARLAYGRHRRVAPFVCLAEVGWVITTRERLARAGGRLADLGYHGYDPTEPTMHALFVAGGPSFRPGAVLAEARAVDVQPLLARLLGLSAPAGDGDPARFEPLLVDGLRAASRP